MTNRPPIGFGLAGIDPKGDPIWEASKEARAAFRAETMRVGLKVKDRSLAKGLDRFGRPMRPISLPTAQARDDDVDPVRGTKPYSPMGRANAKNPPLQATGPRSRTRSLLRAMPIEGGIWFYWDNDPHTGRNWGEVLSLHRRGFDQRFIYPKPGEGHVPSRDVIGLSSADTRDIAGRMKSWWKGNRLRWYRNPAKPPAVVAVEEATGIKWMAHNGEKLVAVDTRKVDAELAKDKGQHVGPGGTGAAKPGRYDQEQARLEYARRTETALPAPALRADKEGNVSLPEGRHRWAALRDEGHPALAVSVPVGQAKRIEAQYGVKPAAAASRILPGMRVPATRPTGPENATTTLAASVYTGHTGPLVPAAGATLARAARFGLLRAQQFRGRTNPLALLLKKKPAP